MSQRRDAPAAAGCRSESRRRAARITPPAAAFLLIAASALPAAAFQVQGIVQFGPSQVAVAFTDSVDAASAGQSAHYTLTPQGGAPALTVQQVLLQENQRTVILVVAPALPASATYDLAVADVTSRSGAPLDPGGPTRFDTVAEAVTGIAAVHADLANLIGQTVTVIGQVYLRASSSGGTPSGYIQDGTGRGLNLFGSPLQPPTDTLGTVVEVTGTVAQLLATVQLTTYTATTLASALPHLGPRVLSAAQAGSPQWEGTYIQTTATLTGPPVASGPNNTNYPASGGGAPITFRVRTSTGIDPAGFATNDLVTGAGAGSSVQTTWQITVGNAADFHKGGGGPDLTPPAMVSASGDGGATRVVITFSEALGGGAGTAANYTLYPTADPGAPIAVTAAAVEVETVTLTLATPLAGAVAYTVAVSNVQDLSGNTLPPASTIAFTSTAIALFEVTGVFQFGANYLGVGFSKPVNAAQAIEVASYAFSPPLAIATATVQENRQTVILRTAAALPSATAFTATVTGVTSATGEPLAGGGPFDFQTVAGTVVDIATIQSDPGAWTNQTVTLVGQTFIPVGSRGGTPSGYLQDGSGHGLNLFGGVIQAAVNDRGTVAIVTGTVELYFTTTEITGYTATAIATAQPPLGARILTVAQANSSQWEGTYIETTADLTAIAASGSSNYNYDASDGVANITFRIGNGLGILPSSFKVGDRVTGRGAGGAFQSTFQINVGNAADFARIGGGTPAPPPPPRAALGAVGGGPFPARTLVRGLSRQGEVFRFEIAGPGGAQAVCRIFDLQGRLTRVLFDGALAAGGRQTLGWDGRDESFEQVAAGVYICHLAITNDAGGGSQARAPIVVAARLDRGTP